MEAYVLPSDLRKCSSIKTSQLTGERLSPTALFITISPLLSMLLILFLIGGGGAFVITLGRMLKFIGTSRLLSLMVVLLLLLLQLLLVLLVVQLLVLEKLCCSIVVVEWLGTGCRSESLRRTVMSSGLSESTSTTAAAAAGGATGGTGFRGISYTTGSYLVVGGVSELSCGPAPGSRIILRRVCTSFFSVTAFG